MEIKRIAPEQAKELLDSNQDYIYLHGRTVPEFEAGHVPGSQECSRGGARRVRTHVTESPICGDRGGQFCQGREMYYWLSERRPLHKSVGVLLSAGFPHVLDMRGGFGGETDGTGRMTFPDWSLCGLPTTRESTPEDRYENLAKK